MLSSLPVLPHDGMPWPRIGTAIVNSPRDIGTALDTIADIAG
ncbi:MULTISPECIES: hypothetical protein [unclassified Streptomyces]|nr:MULTISPECIES: hypothetical protein [unclassified Streptomyces]SCK30957.1 hypothetical protein YW7DRAFT_02437 [Streptomyces sp. AmelKG-E11A]